MYNGYERMPRALITGKTRERKEGKSAWGFEPQNRVHPSDQLSFTPLSFSFFFINIITLK